MGKAGTLLFVPFILLFSGFLIAFFYWVVKSDALPKQSKPKQRERSGYKDNADTSSTKKTTGDRQ